MHIPYDELESLKDRIEADTATSGDYRRYEQLLTRSGLPQEHVLSYLHEAGFHNWEQFVDARHSQEVYASKSNTVIGGLVGLGLGVLLYNALKGV